MSVLFQCARRQIYFVNKDQTNCFIEGLISHISKKKLYWLGLVLARV